MRYKKALSWCVALAVFFPVHRVPCYGGERWKPILDVAVRDDQVYVATVEKGGLYSLEGGRWESLGGTLPSSNLFSLRISPKGHLFLSTYDEALFSMDRGRSWTSLKGGGNVKEFFFTSQGTYLLVDWHRGILRYDGTSSKSKEVKVEGGDFPVTGFSEGPGGSLWASTFGGGMLRSDDDGSTWSPFNSGLDNLFVLSMVWSDTGVLYVGTMEGGVFALGDGEWDKVDGLPYRSVVQAMAYSRGILFAGTLGGVFARTDGGDWISFPLQEGEDVSVRSIAPYRDGVLVGTGEKGLFYVDWDSRSSKAVMMSDSVVSMSLGDDGVWALTRSGKLFSSVDGVSWSDLTSLPGGSYGSLLRHANVAVVGGIGKVYTSHDKAWTGRPLPLREGQGGSAMVVDSDGAFIAALSRGGVFRSIDWGVSWSEIESVDGRYIYSVVSRGKTVAIGTDRGFAVSKDGGRTWENRYIVYGVTSLAIDEKGYLWAASRNGLWRWDLEGLELDTPAIDGFEWSPFNYFTDIFSGKEGSVMGLLRGELVRLSPVSGRYLLERSSLSNNDGILASLSLSDRILISTGRGFYSSVDGGLNWVSIGLPVGIIGR
ncbi:hypothetical protein [Dethiosulfovibrio salsuginis]|uniref:Photosynthesis system II assembly factor Ycf48/Hcf136-like domain-containing protein n=1 Tax=Dethiosulfovibrio salsuginis TaxID=561720 RepID=A0A1X7JLK3_9BACT|nr:hypothetical protein [Dethiosulfovibrio salsuginis]SMG28701.1 hypothetical protein SAMN06275492_11333 [Dethiosulfovibrio salsuginis]